MVKVIAISFCILLLSGCAMTPSANTSSASSPENSRLNEAFLEQSKNYPRLIDLYKDQLKQADNAESRLKLAQIYVDTKDFESALFTLMPMIQSDQAPASAFYLQGVSLYGVGKLEQAEQSLLIAVKRTPDDAKTVNMLGVVQAEQGNLVDARQSFISARGLMYDDVTVKNNLALLDMIEGDFKQAAARLMPIYIANPAKVDAKVKANLAIIVSKLGSFESLKSIYSGRYTEKELFEIFHNLRASEPATRASNKAISAKANTAQSIVKSRTVVLPTSVEQSLYNTRPTSASVNSSQRVSQPQQTIGSYQNDSSSTSQKNVIAVNSPTESQREVPNSVLLSELVKPSVESTVVALPTQSFTPDATVTRQEERRSFTELTGISRRYDRGVGALPEVEPVPEAEITPLAPPHTLQPIVDSAVLDEQAVDVQATKEADFSRLMGIERLYASAPAEKKDATSLLGTSSASNAATQAQNQDSAKTWPKPDQDDEPSQANEFVKLANYSLFSEGVSDIPVAQFRHRGYLIDVTLDAQGNMINVE